MSQAPKADLHQDEDTPNLPDNYNISPSDNYISIEQKTIKDKQDEKKSKLTKEEDQGNRPSSKAFYKKFTQTIIPPLQNTISFLNSGASGPSSFVEENISWINEYYSNDYYEAETSAGSKTNKDEEIDIAIPIGESRPSNYFLNLLTTASIYSGLGKLSKLKKTKEEDDRHFESSEPNAPDTSNVEKSSKGFNMAYDVFENESESESESEGYEEEDLETINETLDIKKLQTNLIDEPAKDEIEAQPIGSIDETKENNNRVYKDLPVNKGNITNDINENIINPNDAHKMIESLTLNDHKLNELFNKELKKDQSLKSDSKSNRKSIIYSNESLNEGTSFQQSILKNLDPHLIKEGLLVKLKEGETKDLEESQYKEKKERLRLRIANKLQQVFELNDDDYFYGNYNVWLIKDVLLQGHLYLTRENILFFAFLPKRYTSNDDYEKSGYTKYNESETIIQSGSLGLKTAKYGDSIFTSVITHRFWAILRPETLSIYSSSTDLYFPSLVIDLRSCIRAEIIDKSSTHMLKLPSQNSSDGMTSPKLFRDSIDNNNSSDDESEISSMFPETATEEHADGVIGGVWFNLVTTKKTYKFYTDSLFSARQWCNNLTKLIFQLNNSNSRNEVLIKIPIENIIDFERNGLLINSGAKEPGLEEEEKPMTLNIKYLENSNQENILSPKGVKRKLNKNYKRKQQKNTEDSIINLSTNFGIDDIYFLFFRNGESFYRIFHQIMHDHQSFKPDKEDLSDNLSLSKQESFFDRAKRIVKKDSMGRHTQTQRSISTLKSPSSPNNIVNQVALMNSHIRKQFVRSPEYMTEQPTNETSKLRKIGRSLSNPAKIFTSKKAIESTSALVSATDKKPDHDVRNISSSSPPPASTISLPRPLSVTGLKNLRMSFETSHRNIEVAESRYSEAKHTPSISLSGCAKDSDGTSLPKIVQPEPIKPPSLSNSLDLNDHLQFDQDANKKQNKLKSFGKGIKALSNVSSMWSAYPSHFEEIVKEDPYYVKDETTKDVSLKHFREHFSFSADKILIASYYIHLQRSIPVYGKLYLGNEELCFRSLLPGVSTIMILPLKDVENCYKEKGLKLTYSGLVVVIHGHEELFLEFSSQKARDDCELMILRQLEKIHRNEACRSQPHEWSKNYDLQLSKSRLESSSSSSPSQSDSDIKLASSRIENARIKLFEDKINAAAGLDIPIILEDSPFLKTEIKPSTSYNFTLLTIGSRGDVQPYIALGKGLLAEGHNVTIATHKEFEPWILKHNMKFKEIAGNPAELMSLMVSHGSMSVAFLKEASSKFRGWINDLLRSSWEACQGTDILIESPSAMGGIHIAEALGIPYMRAFTMPWTRTRAYPHAFIVPDQKKGGSYNYLTHVMFETVFWKGISSQINKWRVEELHLPKTNLYRLQQTKIPFLYNVSPTIFPPSVDFPDWVRVTGYWFLDEGAEKDYKPPVKLIEFLDKAKKDRRKIVYIGFGSIVVNDAKSLTKAISEAVLDADVRCILNKGWSDRLTKKNETEPEIKLHSEIFNSGSIPHDWLFPKIDAAVHHGGSGTTGATLRAGLPTIIKPFFGDQFFYASRIEDIGVGLSLKKLNAKSLSKSLKTVTTDQRIIEKAKKISNKIKHENGVMAAVETIYSELEYARNLIISKQQQNEQYRRHTSEAKSGIQTPVVHEEDEDVEDDEGENVEFSDEDGTGSDNDESNKHITTPIASNNAGSESDSSWLCL